MSSKIKYILVGSVVAGAAIGAGAAAVVRYVRGRAKRVLKRKTRRVMTDVLKMRAEDFMPGGVLGRSVFRSRIEKLDYEQLVALFALVEVGYFIKVSGIDPLHPNKKQIKAAAEKYLLEERLAPATRERLLDELDTSDAYDALNAAFKVLMAQ